MPATPSMKRCPDCKAPNPAARVDCYACGVDLDRPPSGQPAPGERTYPCRNCAAAVPFSAPFCPGCGRATAPGPPAGGFTPVDGRTVADRAAERLARLSALPDGWDIEPLPDGTTLLRRTGWGNLIGREMTPAALILGGILFSFLFTGTRRVRGDAAAVTQAPLLAYGPAILLVLAGVAALVWALCAREQIRVGRHFLEGEKRLGPLRRAWRVEGEWGTLRVDTREHAGYHYGRRYTVRRLVAEVGPRRRVLDSRTHGDGGMGLTDLAVGLSGEPLAGGGGDGAARLGRLLADQTGWYFSDPARGVGDVLTLL